MENQWNLQNEQKVAPLAGAWIEIYYGLRSVDWNNVAPLAGAWIEIGILASISSRKKVAPLAGAWIDTMKASTAVVSVYCII